MVIRIALTAAMVLISHAGLLAQTTMIGKFQQHSIQWQGNDSCPDPPHNPVYTTGSASFSMSDTCRGLSNAAQVTLQFPDTIPATRNDSAGTLTLNPAVTTLIKLNGTWTTPDATYMGSSEIGPSGSDTRCPFVFAPNQNLATGDTNISSQRSCTLSALVPDEFDAGNYKVTFQNYVEMDIAPRSAFDCCGIRVVAYIKSEYVFAPPPPPPDSVSFLAGTIVPDPAAGGLDGSNATHFQTTVQYTVGTVANAGLLLLLYDQAGAGKKLLGSSGLFPVSRSDPTNSSQTLSIDLRSPLDGNQDPTLNLPHTADKLYMVAQLVDANQAVLAETSPQVVYSLLDLKPKIELVQVVQDAANSVKLIRERDTVVRVYPLQTWASNNLVQKIGGTLQVRVFDDSGQLVDSSSSPLNPYNGTVTASDSQGADRTKESSSLNFLLPADLVSKGNGTLSVELTAQLQPPADRTIQRTDHLGLISNPMFTFVPSANGNSQLEVGYMKLCVKFGTVNGCPTDAVSRAGSRMDDLYPVSLLGVDYREMDIQAKPWTGSLDTDDQERLKRRAERIYLRSFAPWGVHKLVVWLPEAARPLTAFTDEFGNSLVVNGSSDPPWNGGAGHVTWVFERSDVLGMARTVAHEVGHNLGLHHTATNDQYPGCIPSTDKAQDWAKNGKYTDGTIQEPGFDASPATPLFKIPAANFDLMNYCPAAVTWISPYHYNQLYSAISALTVSNNQGGANAPQSDTQHGNAIRRASAPSDYLLVSGTIALDGSSGQLDPAEHISSTLAGSVSDPNGSYCLRQTDGNANPLDFCFSPTVIDLDGNSLTQDSFSFQIPYLAAAVRISLMPAGGSPGSELAAYTSAGVPTVAIQAPQPGASLAGLQTLVWSATDPINTPLTYIVDYSTDGGNSWLPLSDTIASTLTDTQYTFDAGTLLAGTQIYFRVTATNGLDSAAASAGPFTIANNPRLAMGSASLDFGNQTVGSRTDLQVTIKNIGTGLLNISSVTSDTVAFRIGSGQMFIESDASRILTVTFAPTVTGTFTGKILVNGGDAKGGATIAVRGVVLDHPAPSIAVSPSSLDFGNVLPTASKDLTLTVSNNGSGPLTINSMTSASAQFSVVSAVVPFTLAPGAQQSVTVRFTPSGTGAKTSILSIASNDPNHSTVVVSLTVNVQGVQPIPGTPPSAVLFSDGFHRADADRCSLGAADLALGGSGSHYYVPLSGVGNPVGANIVAGVLQNNGNGYGGVEFVSSAGACSVYTPATNIGQDVDIQVDLRVPSDAAGHITDAGPFFRGRGAASGDGFLGGANAGYWVQLYSTGQVKVKNLNTAVILASSATPSAFDATITHRLEISARGSTLEVALDGQLVAFPQTGGSATSLPIPATAGSNDGAAGIGFGAELNSGLIGGQRAANLVVSAYR